MEVAVPVAYQTEPIEYLDAIGRNKCCCCDGCCQIGFGFKLGAGLSVIWAILVLIVILAGDVDFFFFERRFTVVFIILWGLTAIAAFITALCFKKYWFVCLPYVLSTFIYVVLLSVTGFIALIAVIKGEGTRVDNIYWFINLPMMGVQLWSLLYSGYYVYHMKVYSHSRRVAVAYSSRPAFKCLTIPRKKKKKTDNTIYRREGEPNPFDLPYEESENDNAGTSRPTRNDGAGTSQPAANNVPAATQPTKAEIDEFVDKIIPVLGSKSLGSIDRY